MKEFDEINKNYLKVYGDNFQIKNIKTFTFWSLEDPIVDTVSVYFIVNTKKERELFQIENLKKCSEEYLVFIKNNEIFQDLKFDFYVLSKEEVKQEYGGNYYYAMK